MAPHSDDGCCPKVLALLRGQRNHRVEVDKHVCPIREPASTDHRLARKRDMVLSIAGKLLSQEVENDEDMDVRAGWGTRVWLALVMDITCLRRCA